jgi:hypothetical protein
MAQATGFFPESPNEVSMEQFYTSYLIDGLIITNVLGGQNLLSLLDL